MDLHILALIVSAFIGLFIAPVSAFFQQLHWPVEIEGLITVVLSAITAFVAQWVANPDWTLADLYAALVTAGLTLLAAFEARARIWLGSRLDAKARNVTVLNSRRPKPGPGRPKHEAKAA